MRIQRFLSFAPVLLALVGCSKSEPKPAASALPEFNTVSDIPADLQSDLESFAGQLERDSRERETNAIRRAFDVKAIADAVFGDIKSNEGRLDKLKNGFTQGLWQSTGQLAAGLAQNNAKYKGLVLYKGSPAARFRFVMDKSGIAIVDLVLRRNAQGKVRIANFCNYAMGYDLVEQARQMSAPMLAELDKGFLARLVNEPNVSPDDMIQFGELAKRTARRDYAGLVIVYKGLRPALKESLPATMMYLAALQNLGNGTDYKQALKEAGRRFNSASFQFMLVDAYYLDKEYDKAIECIDNFMQALEKDAALLTLKSLLLKAKGDVKGALTILREAFKLEPDCTYAHSKGLDVLLAAKDFAALRDSMIFLENSGRYNFKGAMNDPLWDEFKKAPESKKWR